MARARCRPIADFEPTARKRIVHAINDWERTEYGSGQCRDAATIDARLARYDRGLLCYLSHGRLLGYVDIVPLAPEHYDELRDGQVIEERMDPRWIAGNTAAQAGSWYIGSMMVAPRVRASAPAAAHNIARELQLATWDFLAAQGTLPIRILGIQASDAGRAAFLRTGFLPIPMPTDAVDRRPRYERAIVTLGEIESLKCKLVA